MTQHAQVTRDDQKREYIIKIPFNLREIRLSYHSVVGKPILVINELVALVNAEIKARGYVEAYTERLDKTLDNYHEAPTWKRIWWALTNDLPYPPRKD